MDPVVEALAAQHAELGGLLGNLSDEQWRAPTRCEGWDVADVLTHLAQSDEMAIASATGVYGEYISRLSEELGRSTGNVDEGAALMVERERGVPFSQLRQRWSSGAAQLIAILDQMDLSTRVQWVAGELSARTLSTTRLAETWIHSGDIAGAVGAELQQTDRLRDIARLAWRTLPYAFTSSGRTMTGPVAFRLTSPSGQAWDFIPDEPAVTTISGPAAELCDVASRRIDPMATSLVGEGPDAAEVLALVRTYA
jgi:uncharacterized protein (TIGR03084 family)